MKKPTIVTLVRRIIDQEIDYITDTMAARLDCKQRNCRHFLTVFGPPLNFCNTIRDELICLENSSATELPEELRRFILFSIDHTQNKDQYVNLEYGLKKKLEELLI